MANNHGLLFLNKALQSETFGVFARYGITEDSFVSANDRKTYRFIADYNERNGQMPSYAMTVDSVPEFTYIPEITDRFEPLAEGILNRRLAVAYNEFFEGEYNEIKENSNGNVEDVISELTDRLNLLKMKYTNTRSVGVNLKEGVDGYLSEYKKRQLGESFKTWESSMTFINEEIGGYTSGNMYVWFGKSGRGKSAIVLREALEMAQQGANVLLWSLEMPAYEVLTRVYTMLSAKLNKTKLTIDGTTYEGGFDSRDLRNGQMTAEHEREFTDMLDHITEHVSGNITIRGVDDYDFNRRDLTQLESDIEATNADVVLIDPFYYMQYEKNTSKTAGGDAAETSKKLRRLTGQLGVVTFAMTQADETDEKSSDTVRELKLPQRSEVKKTKALLEDASTLIGVDTDYTQRRGIVGIMKGRSGGEGTSTELTYIPSHGIVEQLQIDGEMFEF